MTEQLHTDFLCAGGSDLTGAANVFNVGGNFFSHNGSSTPALADALAIRQDFLMIGEDIKAVASRLELQKSRQATLDL